MAKNFFKRRYLVVLIAFALSFPLLSFASSDYYFKLNSGVKEFFKTVSSRGARQNIASYGDYNITNNCGADVFIPNKTAAEWSLFINNMPNCLVMTSRYCGDSYCQEAYENYYNCPEDYCLSRCGNGVCNTSYGETRTNCVSDCKVCGDGYCDSGETYSNCSSDCQCVSTGCGIDVCGVDNCGNSCGTCNSGETCIYGLCCRMNATINVCGDRDTYVYFNGAYVNQSVESSPLMTNTVSNVRTGYNYVQIKVYDNGPVFWGGNNFALSAGITYTGCRGKSGNIYYHSNTTDLYNWRCTNVYNTYWNSSDSFPFSTYTFYSVPRSVLSDAPHDTDSWCNKNSFYGPPSHQIWADTNKKRSNSETIYCYHRFNLESIVSSGKAKLPTYWCGDGICHYTENYAYCPADCISYCGDGYCDSYSEEDYYNCPVDCYASGYCGDGYCDSYSGEDYYNCSADCYY
ncbi:MAG: hypothetical protein ACOYJ1_11395 [Peptococcales bacterium]|jgi:hypothetical protein